MQGSMWTRDGMAPGAFGRSGPLMLLAACLMFDAVAGCDSGAKGGLAAGGNGGTANGNGTGGTASATGGAEAGGQGGSADALTFEGIMGAYLSWQPQSEMPVDISALIFSLCRRPTAAESAFTDSVHSHFAVRDWANAAAAAAIATHGAGGFPAGSAIVKEKFAGAPAGPLELAALGIMVKRAPGSFPDSDDWEFAYWNPSDGLSSNAVQLATCAACHKDPTSATDYVFLDGLWSKPSAP